MLGMEGEGRERPGRRGQRWDAPSCIPLRGAGGEIIPLGSGHVTIASRAGDTAPRYATRGIHGF